MDHAKMENILAHKKKHKVKVIGEGDAFIGTVAHNYTVYQSDDCVSGIVFSGEVTVPNDRYPVVYCEPHVGYYTAEKKDCDTDPLNATVTFKECKLLDLKVEATEGGTGACAGYCVVDPAKKYYGVDKVRITAIPKDGYTFAGWKGKGVAWTSEYYVDNYACEQCIHLHNTPTTNRNVIWIRMKNQAGELVDRSIIAVFKYKDCCEKGPI